MPGVFGIQRVTRNKNDRLVARVAVNYIRLSHRKITMNYAEKWVIQNTHGQLLQSFAIDPEKIRIDWYRPDAPGKTKAGEKGPLNFLAESKAQVLLMALVSQVPTEFAGAKVMTLAQALSPVSTLTS